MTETRKWRVGTVPYLVARPLTDGLLEHPQIDLVVAPPAELAEGLRGGYLDVALASSAITLGDSDLKFWDGGPVIASDGPIRSVLLFLRPGLENLSEVQTWYADPHSRTGRALAGIVLAGNGALHAACLEVPGEDPFGDACAFDVDAVQLIGDPALAASSVQNDWKIIDLGVSWKELTRLPFVFAGWILRPGFELGGLESCLTDAAARGLAGRASLAAAAAGNFGKDAQFFHRYLCEDLCYQLPAATIRESLSAFAQNLVLG
jgi:chorismate dehydratase